MQTLYCCDDMSQLANFMWLVVAAILERRLSEAAHGHYDGLTTISHLAGVDYLCLSRYETKTRVVLNLP